MAQKVDPILKFPIRVDMITAEDHQNDSSLLHVIIEGTKVTKIHLIVPSENLIIPLSHKAKRLTHNES